MKAERDLLHLAFLLLIVNMALTVNAASPGISYPPRSQAVILYQQAAFGVIASGTAPLAYQWRKHGGPIAGATNDQIVLPRAQFSDAGLYSVIVSNAQGSVTSADVGLMINHPAGGDLDCSFACGGSINGAVLSAAVQPDGRILIAGYFSTVHGAARGRIARLNADGTTDYTFMNGLSGADEGVSSVTLQSDGKIIIGGYFTTVNGVSRNNIARLNADGTLDSSFQTQISGIYSFVYSVAVQSDGKVLIGGYFTEVNGVTRNRIARLNADGTLDNNFQNGLSGANSYVFSLAVQSDGKLLIGGAFTEVNGVTRNRIARLNTDGTLDSNFQTELPGVNDRVYAIALQSDGKLLIGGSFTKVNGVSRNFIARLNANGTMDSSFQNGLSSVSHTSLSVVYSMAVQSDGKILFGGYFQSDRNYFARLNTDGTLDSSFQSGLSGVSGSVLSVTLQSDGKILIGGLFTTVNGTSRHRIARLDADGTLDSGVQNGLSGINGYVFSVALQSDGRVLIGGDFKFVNGFSRNNIARLNADGTLDNGYQNGLSGTSGRFADVRSIAVQSDGKALIGGYFTNVNGVSRNGIARLDMDGKLDSSFQNGLSGSDNIIYSIALQSDGKALVGGANGIARLHSDGTRDSTFISSTHFVRSIAVQSDGKVLIGGDFKLVNGVSRNNIARLNADGTLDNGFQNEISEGDNLVWSVALQSDGKALVGGRFTTLPGVSRTNIARLNADGTLDSSFQTQVSGYYDSVYSIAVQKDGKVVIGGEFATVNGVSRVRIARLNTDGTLDSGFQAGLSGTGNWVYSVAVQSDGKVLIGGSFTMVNGMPAASVARLWGNPPAYIENLTRPHDGSATLTLRLPVGSTHRVQYKTHLTDATWIDLPGDVIATGSTGLTNKVDATLGTAPQRFYRVWQLP